MLQIEVQPALFSMATEGYFGEQGGRGVKLTAILRMGGAAPPPPRLSSLRAQVDFIAHFGINRQVGFTPFTGHESP
jgi:hypothetical protein